MKYCRAVHQKDANIMDVTFCCYYSFPS